MGSKSAGAALLAAALAACGSGGGGSNSTGTGAVRYGDIALLGHEPADNAVQVPLGTSIALRFDAVLAEGSLRDADTWLRPIVGGAVAGGDAVAGAFRVDDAGHTAVFTPDQPLAAETEYRFQVSALTCDRDGRLLDETRAFLFRTFDATPPRLLSADVSPGEQDRSRTAPLMLTMSEPLAPQSLTAATVRLRDSFGQSFACACTCSGAQLAVQPLADLPGARDCTLSLTTGVQDVAGNALAAPWSVAFRTAADTTPPTATGIWPANGSTNVSPAVQPVVHFSESMDPLSVEPASVLFQDQYGGLVAFTVAASPDQRTLRICPQAPLLPGQGYVLAFLVGAAGVTDVSGNQLASSQAISFTVGSDALPPAVASARPAAGETHVSLNATPTLVFDEPLDPAWVGGATVALWRDGDPVAAVVTLVGQDTVRVTPVLQLDPDRSYRVVVAGGQDGVRDLAGNLLADDLEYPFATAADATLPGALLFPADGAVAVPPGARVVALFDSPLDAATVSPATCELRDDTGQPVPAVVSLDDSHRAVHIAPDFALLPGAYYRTFVRGGPDGVREASGNWLGDDLRARFRVGTLSDHTPPAVLVTVDGLDSSRRNGAVLPPSGFTIDVDVSDPERSLDMTSVRVQFTGAGSGPSPEQLFATATVGFEDFHTTVPAAAALSPGDWTLTVSVDDLSGNTGTSAPIALQVATATPDALPFESTQVVWVRTDFDRDANGLPDFDDDLLRLGLATAGDPAGTNAAMRAMLLQAVIARANALFGRAPDGEPLGADSVPIRLVTRAPAAVKHLEIALGGLDPEGNGGRGYGAPSTGILGRAFFDRRNADMDDRDVGNSPGLGVFPAEMWLYQVQIHRQVYPSFQTMFAQRFLPLCPPMGGTPVGSGPLDAIVLAPGFDPDAAPSEQRARWLAIARAVDDWAMVTGTVLAHEVGHAVGLVAPGPLPGGLFGDQTFHDSNAGAAEVMAATVGYESMITLDYAFRDTDLAYLRQRLILR